MKCLQCAGEKFVNKSDAVLEQQFRGELIHVHAPAMACTKCGWITIDLRQLDTLRRLTADAYREKYDLLTSVQIKAFRRLLRMSQREFAAFLGVGEASVKRWETWLVQEKSSDRLIRMKCEKECNDRLCREGTSPPWIQCEHHVIEAADGISIQRCTPAEEISPSKWNLQADSPESGNDHSSEANDDTAFTHAA